MEVFEFSDIFQDLLYYLFMTENSANINIGDYAVEFDLPQSTKLDRLRDRALERVTSREFSIDRVIENATFDGLSVIDRGGTPLIRFTDVIGLFESDDMLAGFFAAEWSSEGDKPEVLLPYTDSHVDYHTTSVLRMKPSDALKTLVKCGELNGIDVPNLYLRLKNNSKMIMPRGWDSDTVLASDELARGLKAMLERDAE